MSLPILVTMSSIPPRFSHLPEHFAMLEGQSMRPLKVELNLARRYRRFPGELPSLPPLPDWVDVHWVDHDLGPATKILPTCRRYRGQNVGLLFGDDDQTYGRRWIESFSKGAGTVDAEVLCAMGFDVLRRFGLGGHPTLHPRAEPFKFTVKDALSHVYNDVLSFLERDKKNREWPQTSYPGYVDIFEGFRGVLVRPDTFPESAWDIRERFCVADDVWLSGKVAASGARVWLLNMPVNRQRIETRGLISPLFKLVHDGMDRDALYKECIRHFQNAHGIWT